MIKLGHYRHYRGKEDEKYEVIAIAKHTETMEDMVVYKALYGEGVVWTRPLKMFEEQVEFDGKSVPRFTFLD